MKRYSIILIFSLIVACAFLPAQETRKERTKPVSFSKDVFPLISKRCLPCHAADSENPSELYLETFDDLMKGGKHGSPLIKKKGSESILVQKLKPNPPFGDRMPLMTKKKLTDDEVDLFEKWIDQGAKKN
jgi:uncharacterized membrane protein